MFEIYTDGSAIGNPGPGGWGAVILDGKTRRCWRQCAKGPRWRTTRTTLPLVDGSRNITRLAGWRAGDLTLCELLLQGKVQKRIGRAAARGNAGSGCCQRKHHHNPDGTPSRPSGPAVRSHAPLRTFINCACCACSASA